jgi:uncharacterized Zn finger protein (UPF0148 family)
MERILGDHMLKGWILLADTCPKGCNVPLVQQKTSGMQKCVQCNYEQSKQGIIRDSGPSKQLRVDDIGSKSHPTESVEDSACASAKGSIAKQLVLQAEQLSYLTTRQEIREQLDVIDRLLVIYDKLKSM